jgi:hypothetical protein
MKALRAVLPAGTQVYMVGGVGPDGFADWRRRGHGLRPWHIPLRPGDRAEDVANGRAQMVAAWDGRGMSITFDDTPASWAKARSGIPSGGQLFWFDILGCRL